jgi:hypothetical protein
VTLAHNIGEPLRRIQVEPITLPVPQRLPAMPTPIPTPTPSPTPSAPPPLQDPELVPVGPAEPTEGFFSIFKRGMKGIYQHCSGEHLHRYLAEFDFRYNERGVKDTERAEVALRGIMGKRLTYLDSSLGR